MIEMPMLLVYINEKGPSWHTWWDDWIVLIMSFEWNPVVEAGLSLMEKLIEEQINLTSLTFIFGLLCNLDGTLSPLCFGRVVIKVKKYTVNEQEK